MAVVSLPIKNKKIQLIFLKNMRTDGLWYYSLENSRERRRKRQRINQDNRMIVWFIQWRRRMISVLKDLKKINTI